MMHTQTLIDKTFKQGNANIAFLVAGDGGVERTIAVASAIIRGGANMLEISMPFSDPTVDGTVIQNASKRALAQKISFRNVLTITQAIKQKHPIPIILYSYLNPMIALQRQGHLSQLRAAGVDGVLIVDQPFDVSLPIQTDLQQQNIPMIHVVAESTSTLRTQQIAQLPHGFLYYACQRGTTGIKSALPDNFVSKITALKAIATKPVVVGFGISTQHQVQQVRQYADGVVIGSYFVDAIARGLPTTALTQLASHLFSNEKHREREAQ